MTHPQPVSQPELGSLLRLCREIKGLSLRALSKEAKVHDALISQIETGHVKEPSFRNMVRLARALNVPIKRFAETVAE